MEVFFWIEPSLAYLENKELAKHLKTGNTSLLGWTLIWKWFYSSEGTIINFTMKQQVHKGSRFFTLRYHRTKNSQRSQDHPGVRIWVTRRGRLSITSFQVHVQNVGGTPYLRNSLICILKALQSLLGKWQGMRGLYINGYNKEFQFFMSVTQQFAWDPREWQIVLGVLQ